VGAHPGLPDLQGFGRRTMAVSPEEARGLMLYQMGALEAFAGAGTACATSRPTGRSTTWPPKTPAGRSDRLGRESLRSPPWSWWPVRQRADQGRRGVLVHSTDYIKGIDEDITGMKCVYKHS